MTRIRLKQDRFTLHKPQDRLARSADRFQIFGAPPRLKSRRDDLFIDERSKGYFFLFFSGAGQCACSYLNVSTRAAEKQKENGFIGSMYYKQVIPTGFQNLHDGSGSRGGDADIFGSDRTVLR